MKILRLGEMLVQNDVLTQEELDDALSKQRGSGKRLGTVLIDEGYITEKQLITTLKTQLGIDEVDLNEMTIPPEMATYIPKSVAVNNRIVPVKLEGDRLFIAMEDPLNFRAIEEAKEVSRKKITPMITYSAMITRALSVVYENEGAANAIKEMREERGLTIGEMAAEQEAQDENAAAPTVKLVNSILERAITDKASDIHIEPTNGKMRIRIRVDGRLVEIPIDIPKEFQSNVISRIKVMGDMNITERRIPQDGHFRVRIQGQIVNVRVNVIPTVFGEKVVMRLIMSVVEIDHNETFGMAQDAFEKFSEMLKMPNGLIYITGPTGSGKSTTLYNALASLSHKQVNISTIEDPVEKNLPRLNQVQVHPQAGLTFEIGLRALMRQDPDIIMVGETRDAETATIAIRAAITGHLVLSTLHTNDAASTVVRLIDMGSEPYLLSSALAGVVAQRLVRKVCPHCGKIERLTDAQIEFVGHDIPTAKKAVGCVHCHGAGYLGRTAIHEVLVVDKELRKMVAANATAEEMKKYAIANQGMVTLKQACIKLVEQGITTMEELERVAYYDD